MRKIAGEFRTGNPRIRVQGYGTGQLKGWNVLRSALDLQPIHLPSVEFCGEGYAFRSKAD